MSNPTRSRFSTFDLAVIGLMSALVFVSSMISINIPTVMNISRIHLGNAFCLLSGLLLGGVQGGFAAGIGSCFFDLTNPLYISSAPFTFAFKFLMAFVCGKVAHRGDSRATKLSQNILASALGALTYVILYLGKNFLEDTLFLRTEMATALIDVSQKAATSLTNAAIAVIISVPLWTAIRAALGRTSLAGKLTIR